jgi:hypothetical protein
MVLQTGRYAGRLDNPLQLVGVTASGRSNALSMLSQLAQRVAAAQPIPRALQFAATPSIAHQSSASSLVDSNSDGSGPPAAAPASRRSRDSLREKNVCGECYRDCNGQCPKCNPRNRDDLCLSCGVCDDCGLNYTEDKDGILREHAICGKCYEGCNEYCPKCQKKGRGRAFGVLTLCGPCGTCEACFAYYGSS